MVSLWCPFTYLHSREAAASTRLAIIFGRIASGIAWFLCSTVVLMQLMYQYMYCQCSVTTVQALMLAVVALKQPRTILHDDSGVVFCRKKIWVSGRLGMPRRKLLYMPRTSYWVVKDTHNNPPSRQHLFIIYLIKGMLCFYRITMSLKLPLVPKSDVKQQFTTTTSFYETYYTKNGVFF